MIVELIKSVFLLIVLVPAVIVAVLAAFSYAKEKLVDRFGHPLKNTDKNVRKAYVMKSNDEYQLKNVVLNDSNIDVRIAALDRIDDEQMLKEIAECENDSISRLAEKRINDKIVIET